MSDLFQIFESAFEVLPSKTKHAFLLALSGGKDSTLLFHWFLKYNISFEAAHINFGLRGQESNEDELFVRKLCAQHNIHLHVFDASDQMVNLHNGIQEMARNIRYQKLNEILLIRKLEFIVTAHHASDQAETVLFRILRGNGFQSLSAMSMLNGNIFRPLLKIPLSDLLNWAWKNQIQYREDSSNNEIKYKRNQLRNILIPDMLHAFPQCLNSLNRLADEAQIINGLLSEYSSLIQKKISQKTEDDDMLIDLNLLMQCTRYPEFLLGLLLEKFQFPNATGYNILASWKTESIGAMYNSSTHSAVIESNGLFIQKNTNQLQNTLIIRWGDSRFSWGNSDFLIQYNSDRSPTDNIFIIPQNQTIFPIQIRCPKMGDRITPLGMNGNSKLLSDIFINKKINRILRKSLPVFISCQGDIIGIPGVCFSEKFKLSNQFPSISISKNPH